MTDTKKYKKFGLLLDAQIEEDKILIEFLEKNRGNSRRESYSSILRQALKLYMATKKED